MIQLAEKPWKRGNEDSLFLKAIYTVKLLYYSFVLEIVVEKFGFQSPDVITTDLYYRISSTGYALFGAIKICIQFDCITIYFYKRAL